jgi:hypothetical protein
VPGGLKACVENVVLGMKLFLSPQNTARLKIWRMMTKRVYVGLVGRSSPFSVAYLGIELNIFPINLEPELEIRLGQLKRMVLDRP